MAVLTDALPGAPAPAPPSATGVDTAVKDKNENWRFLEPQPVREDQVENAVKFLSHPKVKGSPVVYRRSFLEKKGLSREEIDEAFRRAPDPPSDTSATTVPTAGTQTGAVGGTSNWPPQVAQVQAGNTQLAAKPASSWMQMFLALGVLTAAGAGAGVLTKKYFIPKFKEWIREIVSGQSTHVEPAKASKPSPIEEATKAAAAAAATAATAATQVAAAIQEITASRSEDRQRLDSIIRAVEVQTKELKNTLVGMRDAVQIAEVTKHQRSVANDVSGSGGDILDYMKAQVSGVKPAFASESRAVTTKSLNFEAVSDSSAGFDSNGQVNVVSPPANGTIHAPHSQSYLDVMAMLERGEKPPGIKEVNDKPPNPNQPLSNPRLQPRPKPWEKAVVDAQPILSTGNGDSSQPGRFNENWNVGGPGVRTELTIGSTAGSSAEPWWRRKAENDSVPNTSSVKITEVDPVTETDIATVVPTAQPSSSSSFRVSGGRPGWVPPAIPQPIYPGAEQAIKRPKPAGGGAARSVPLALSESGSADGASTTSQGDSHSFRELVDNPGQSNNIQPEQLAEVPGEEESDNLETGLVDPTPFRDEQEDKE